MHKLGGNVPLLEPRHFKSPLKNEPRTVVKVVERDPIFENTSAPVLAS